MHTLPDLKRLQEWRRTRGHRHPLGEVHQRAQVRQHPPHPHPHDIDYPVANDASFAIWKAYGARLADAGVD
jgi:hypothetical protein